MDKKVAVVEQVKEVALAHQNGLSNELCEKGWVKTLELSEVYEEEFDMELSLLFPKDSNIIKEENLELRRVVDARLDTMKRSIERLGWYLFAQVNVDGVESEANFEFVVSTDPAWDNIVWWSR